MLLSEPQPTSWDLNFNLLGTQVRVHPLFWVMALLVTYNSGRANLGIISLGIIAVFVSILVHELGHVLAFRWHGVHADVVLHAFGGLAIPGRPGLWGRQETYYRRGQEQTPLAQGLIAFAGPLAGFLLAGIVLAALAATGRTIDFDAIRIFGVPFPTWSPGFELHSINALVFTLLWVNIFWGLFNLLPIWPLDGGRIARAIFVATLQSTHEGARRSLWLSIFTIGALLVLSFKFSDGLGMNTLLLVSFLASNFQELQIYQGWGRGW